MTFDLQPTLEGASLKVRPLRDADFQSLYTVASDPLIWQQHPANDRHEEDVFKAFFQEAIDSGGALVVVDKKSEKIIGSSRYHNFVEEDRTVEIGWTFLAREYWGGDCNGELKQLMLQHAFQYVDSALFLIGPDNVRSKRAIEKIGGTEIGSKPIGPGGLSLVFEVTATARKER